MAQTFTSEIFSSTYRDDFKDSDNYHRVLFNSGRALQARELTQLQTIIQKEMSRLGKHLFKEGAAINPGGVTVNTEYEFVKLDTTVNQLPATITDLVGVEFTSAGSISFRVLEVVAATGLDPATLYVAYTNTSAGQVQQLLLELLQAKNLQVQHLLLLFSLPILFLTQLSAKGVKHLSTVVISLLKNTLYLLLSNQRLLQSIQTNLPLAWASKLLRIS